MSAARAEFGLRAEPLMRLAGDSERVARASRSMAARFGGGGRLFVFGTGRAATDAQHVAVEFVHPVIVGKRALPALALVCDVATLTGVATSHGWAEVFARQIGLLGCEADIALGISDDDRDEAVRRGLEVAGQAGMLTVALTGGAGDESSSSQADHCLVAASGDPLIVQEVQVTTYHVLWELVHVFLEAAPGPNHRPGRAA